MIPLLAQFGGQLITAGLTLATAYLGFRWAAYNDERKDSRAAQREREQRDSEAARRFEEERHRQQLEALMALQEDVQLVARTAAQGLFIDHMRAREGNADPRHPDRLAEEDRLAHVNMNIHVSRVLDEGVRESVTEMRDTLTEVTLLPLALRGLKGEALEEAANREWEKFNAAVLSTVDALGEAVRREIKWSPPPLEVQGPPAVQRRTLRRPGPR